MSYKGMKPTFKGESPGNGDILALIDCELINWLSFHAELDISGATPNATITVEESNKNDDASFIPTLQTKNYTLPGATNDILYISQATSRWYRLKLSLSAGTVDSYEVTVSGKG